MQEKITFCHFFCSFKRKSVDWNNERGFNFLSFSWTFISKKEPMRQKMRVSSLCCFVNVSFISIIQFALNNITCLHQKRVYTSLSSSCPQRVHQILLLPARVCMHFMEMVPNAYPTIHWCMHWIPVKYKWIYAWADNKADNNSWGGST